MPERRLDIWLPAYIGSAPARTYARLRRRRRLTDIIFLICDHFEPRHGITSPQQAFDRLRRWVSGYAAFRQRCLDAFGNAPLHTWFYPPHHGSEHLASLAEMVFAGLGEVELHYHHRDDTEETLREGLRSTLAEYRRWGMLLEAGAPPRQSFGFVHGDWALNNSCRGELCGVNDEITILRELGCWADFTMPSGNLCQTRKINSIYYASSDARRPKAHDRGVDARVGVTDTPGLLLLQGPLGINWRAPKYPRIENAALTAANWGRADRIRCWLDCNIQVRGRPEWLFVKLHAHGAIERDFEALFGERAFAMHRQLNERYNDGRNYRLHYVTARQAFNIVKAAEHGKGGNPSEWRDFRLGPPAHAFYTLDAPHDLEICTAGHLKLTNIDVSSVANLRARVGPVQLVRGPIGALEIDDAKAELRLWSQAGPATTGKFTIELEAGSALERIEGGAVLADETNNGVQRIVVDVPRSGVLRYRRGVAQTLATAATG
jgi:hypothetical protein